MTTLSQSIPNLLSGISQQPDSRKRPGQLKDAVNAFPDFALGLLKRPGGKFVAELHNAPTTGKWFPILRDNVEKYIACYENNRFHVWDLIDRTDANGNVTTHAGSVRVVDMGNNTGQPVACDPAEVLTEANELNDEVDDTSEELGELHTAETTLAKAIPGQLETISRLFELTYDYSGQYVKESLRSGIIQDADGKYLVKNNDTVVASQTTTLPANYALGTERTDEHPLLASQGYRIFEAHLTVAATHTAQNLTDAENAYDNTINSVNANGALQDFNTAETDETTARTNYNADFNACAIATIPTNTLRITQAGTGLTNGASTAQATATTGDGTNMTVDVRVEDGQVHIANINAAGSNYSLDDTITLTAAGFADAVRITTAGSGLSNGSSTGVATTAITGTGSGMTVDITISGGAVTAATINAAGTGYRNGDTVSIDGQAGTVLTFSNVELEFARPAYLQGATTDDIELLTLNDSTFVLNKQRTVAMREKLSHATGTDENRAQVVIAVAANSTAYEVLLTQNGTTTTFSHTSGSSGASADNIADGLQTAIDANAAYTATQVGASIYITSTSAFNVEVRGGSSESAIFALADTIGDSTRLPLQSRNGYIVRVVNSEDIDIDDMFVKFTTDSGSNFGTGQWEETLEPGIKYEFDNLTMPHRLVRQANGVFTYEPVDWNDRLVGDENTNPTPSFVGGTISHIFFYRNRMGFLSGQNVILSKAGDLFNFWNTSALTATNDDPIDISAAGKRPVFLHYVEPTSIGLVMYSTNEQFLLTTDSDILAPTSAKVNAMSAYECDANVESVSLGTSQAFISKTPLYTRVFELNDVSSEQPPLMADITNVVPELIPESINSMVSSPALSIVSLGQIGTSTLYQYRFLSKNRNERLLNSWYKWELTGTLLAQFFDSSTFYAVTALVDRGVRSFDTFATTTAFPASSDSVAITITNPTTNLTGSGVTGTATTDGSGNITDITITTPGANYRENDAVTIRQTGGNGVGTAAVNELDNEVVVQSFDMTQSSEEGFLTLPTGEKTDVCLDLFHINPHRTYTENTDKTRVFLPYEPVTGKTFNVVVLGGYIGDTSTVSSQSVGAVLSPTVAGTVGNRHVDIDGDYRGRDIIIGYNYDMTVDLPKLYRYSSANEQVTNDDVSSLIIHRLKVKTGLSGPVDYRVTITGTSPWTNTISVTQPNQYQLNNVNMQASSTHVVPIFQRNENLAIRIIGNTPFPVSLLGLDWEGKLNQRFYRRG